MPTTQMTMPPPPALAAGPTRPAPHGPAHLPAASPARPDRAKVMIVDDEPINIKVVRKHLQTAGYANFHTLTEPTAVLDAVERERPDVLLLDVVMPGMTGLQILEGMSRAGLLLHVPVLILTASTDAATKLQALELGATDFLAKPVDPNELVPRLRNTLAAKAYHDHLASYSERLELEVRARTTELEASRRHVVHCLARAGERRDDATGNHVVRVGRYAGVIARGMGLPPADVEMIALAALLHDVGKIGVPDAILLKPGKLTSEEYAVMRRHCEYGEGIIAPASAPEPKGPGAKCRNYRPNRRCRPPGGRSRARRPCRPQPPTRPRPCWRRPPESRRLITRSGTGPVIPAGSRARPSPSRGG